MSVIRHGVHRQLEDQANRLIVESLKGNRSYADKSDILTRAKMRLRYSREILVPHADASVRLGSYNRAANTTQPHLNSRDGVTRVRRDIGGTLASFVTDSDV